MLTDWRKSHLAPFLPGDPLSEGSGAVSGAEYGSASILPISWAYIAMCGSEGLTKASQVAILSANYLAVRLQDHFSILYQGKNGRSAHECILDVRPFKKYGIEVTDMAKRLSTMVFMLRRCPGTICWYTYGRTYRIGTSV